MLLKKLSNWNAYVTELISQGQYEAAKKEILKEAEGLTDNDNIFDWVALVKDELDYVSEEEREENAFELTDVTLTNFLEDVSVILFKETFKNPITLKTEDQELGKHEYKFDNGESLLRAINNYEDTAPELRSKITYIILDNEDIIEEFMNENAKVVDLYEALEYTYNR